MLSRYKSYRRWRGGYWVYTHFINWRKVSESEYCRAKFDRGNENHWSLECYEDIDPYMVKHPAPEPFPLGTLTITETTYDPHAR